MEPGRALKTGKSPLRKKLKLFNRINHNSMKSWWAFVVAVTMTAFHFGVPESGS